MSQKLGKKSRSAAYPLLSLPEAIESAQTTVDNLGFGPHSRESLARGMGYASFSGAVSGKIGAMVHFGLLSRLAGRYSFTDLARSIFSHPLEAVSFEISQAASRPAIYRALIARFLDEALPRDLKGLLVSDYKITPKAAALAAQNFIKTMEFAGLIKDGRIAGPDAEFSGAEDIADPQIAFAPPADSLPAKTKDKIIIKLPSGVEISFPCRLAYRISMGEFALELKNIDEKAAGPAMSG